MTWSEEAWKAAEPIYEQILGLEFIKQLGDGTLSRERFLRYLEQDKLYLAEYAKALGLISARAENIQDMEQWAKFAIGAGAAEIKVHNYFLEETGERAAAASAPPQKNPSCELYTSFLLRHAALSPLEVAAAAVLPCFWIYAKVGEWHYGKLAAIEDHPFEKWIAAYAGESYEEAVTTAIEFADRLAAASTPQRRAQMTDAFVKCSIMELMFWQAAHEDEQWPYPAAGRGAASPEK